MHVVTLGSACRVGCACSSLASNWLELNANTRRFKRGFLMSKMFNAPDRKGVPHLVSQSMPPLHTQHFVSGQFINQGYPQMPHLRQQVPPAAFQPLYVIPITTAQPLPPNIAVQSHNADLPCPTLEPQCSNWNISSGHKRGRKSDVLPEERDFNRRVSSKFIVNLFHLAIQHQ